MIFKFHLETLARRAVSRALVEDAFYVGGERDKIQQMLLEDSFALLGVGLGKDTARGRKFQPILLQFGKFENVKRLSRSEKLVELQIERVCELGEFRSATTGRFRQSSR